MINLHCILRTTSNPQIIALQEAAKASWPAHQSVTYTEVLESTPGNHITRRINAFTDNNAKFVGLVDDDDLLIAGPALQLFDHVIAKSPNIIQSGKAITDISGREFTPIREVTTLYTLQTVLRRHASMHHLIIARKDLAILAAHSARKVIENHYDEADYGIFDLAYTLELLKISKCEYFPQIVYKWRRYSEEQGHNKLNDPINQLFSSYQQKYLK